MKVKCPNCGYLGKPKKRINRTSSTITGLLLLFSLVFPWLLFLGVPALLLMLFEKREISCQKCGYQHVIRNPSLQPDGQARS